MEMLWVREVERGMLMEEKVPVLVKLVRETVTYDI